MSARVAGFLLYLFALLALPPTLLWRTPGAIFGMAMTAIAIIYLRVYATKRIADRLGARILSPVESPSIHAAIVEYARRLRMPPPRLMLIESPAVNVAAFGFARNDSVIAITSGTIEKLKRLELSTILALAICFHEKGHARLGTWLSQFLRMANSIASPGGSKPRSQHRAIGGVLRQTLIYPLTIIPKFLLHREGGLLERAARLSQHPLPLDEALRKLQIYRERSPLVVSVSEQHLFLTAPRIRESVARVLYDTQLLGAH